MAKLSASMRKKYYNALLDALITFKEFEKLYRNMFGDDLSQICTADTPLGEVANKILTTSEAKDNSPELLNKALEINPSNKALQTLIAGIQKKVLATTKTMASEKAMSEQAIGFVNRKKELESIFLNPGQISRYWVIDAPAGYGKSQLLAEAEKRYKQDNWLTVKVEFPRQALPSRPTVTSTLEINKYDSAVFVSYAWGGDSERTVDELEKAFAERGIRIVRDKKELGYKGSIQDFEQRIGQGQCVILVISDKYLRSEHCLYELVEIEEHKDFRKRIFPVVLSDAHIYKALDRLSYIKHWDEQIAQLNHAIKQVSVMTNLAGISADLDKYARIRANLDHLTDLLSDMNTLTPEIHANTGYSTLIDAIQSILAEEPAKQNQPDEIAASEQSQPINELHSSLNSPSILDLVALPILAQVRNKPTLEINHSLPPEIIGLDIATAILEAVKTTKKKLLPGIAIIVDNLEECPDSEIPGFLQLISGIFTGLNNSSYFFQSKRLRVFISGRYARNKLKPVTDEIMMADIVLAPFTFEVIMETIQEFAISRGTSGGLSQATDIAAHLMHITGGHPGFTAEILNSFAESHFTRGVRQLSENANLYQLNFTEKFYNQLIQAPPKLNGHPLSDILVRLSPFRKYERWFFLKELKNRGFLPENLDEESLEKGLLSTYLVDRQGGFLHDGIYRYLLEIWLRLHNPTLYADLCNAGIEIYKKQVSSGGNVRRFEKWAIEFIYLSLVQNYYVQKAGPEILIQQTQQNITWVINELARLKSNFSQEDLESVHEDFVNGLRGDAELRFLYNFCTPTDDHYAIRSFDKLLYFVNDEFRRLF
jgi:hypothetical protein